MLLSCVADFFKYCFLTSPDIPFNRILGTNFELKLIMIILIYITQNRESNLNLNYMFDVLLHLFNCFYKLLQICNNILSEEN